MTRAVLVVFMLMLLVVPSALAQDDRANENPGDRVIVYCRDNGIEVWGARPDSTGVFLAQIDYTELLAPGQVTLLTRNGQIIADGDTTGMIDVQWIGGEFGGNGLGDFLAWVTCSLPVIVFTETPQTTETPTDTNTTVTTDDVLVLDNVTAPTTDTVTTTPTTTVTNDAVCGNRPYTVREGDNLFRIGLRYGIDYHTLAACNNIADPRRIYVGQVIYVP